MYYMKGNFVKLMGKTSLGENRSRRISLVRLGNKN
jgi:hypothetical protein